jgi:putative glutamine amidotransferase
MRLLDGTRQGEDMTQPLIGITAHETSAPDRASLDRLLDQIIRAVAVAGGLPVVIPAGLDESTLAGLFARIDGLLLSGGGDVDPEWYGATPTAVIGGVDRVRDQAELNLARWALRDAKPVFGICRGLQVLNVACGGTLYRDISEHSNAQRHTYYPDYPFDLLAHRIGITPESELARIVGRTSLTVNSLHHQACRTVAAGLQVVARAPDGVVEALEAPDHPFALAVQWHPEALSALVEMQALFQAMVSASARCAAAPIL